MQITFEFWGVLSRVAGAGERDLHLAAPVTVAQALALLAQELPVLQPHLQSAAVATGERLLLRTDTLRTDLRLALLPPVAGG